MPTNRPIQVANATLAACCWSLCAQYSPTAAPTRGIKHAHQPHEESQNSANCCADQGQLARAHASGTQNRHKIERPSEHRQDTDNCHGPGPHAREIVDPRPQEHATPNQQSARNSGSTVPANPVKISAALASHKKLKSKAVFQGNLWCSWGCYAMATGMALSIKVSECLMIFIQI